MVCDVLIELTNVFINKTFTYKLTTEQKDLAKVGMRVKVPFGKQTLEGFILNIRKYNNEDNLKEVICFTDDYPILNKELLKLGEFISKTTLSSLMLSYSAMLPKALKAKNKVNINILYEKFIKINKKIDLTNIKLNKTQNEILDILIQQKEVKKEELNKISCSSLKTLLNKKIVLEISREYYRYNTEKVVKNSFKLNNEQKLVYDEVINNLSKNIIYLLYGVTGSGKTNVYMQIIEDVIKLKKTAIVLVPEISLTPQIINRFTSKFSRIAVLHSGLSDGEKYDEWRKIKEGKVDIVIGARSAIFAPLENIGIIIIDEEHSSTYKQENSPRYNAIDIAKERCIYHNCPLLLGSATPSLESYARALKGVYKLLTLKSRYNEKQLPDVSIVDMNKEFRKNNSFFSNVLIEKIRDKINKNEQIILFLNKRGYSSLIICKNCGEVPKCPNCDISLTYHKTSNMLRCHYCGYAIKRYDKCPNCHEEFKDMGMGTEKALEELNKLVPEAKIIRMDVDTTSKKDSVKKIIKSFSNREYNILLGTQMISKGLDFPNVTLVGVINADIGLNLPDFRSSEITFDLLNQVLGRSGRGDKEGEVIIQTFNPDHYAIKYTINHDYEGFFKEEMSIRRKLKYPPYYYICSIKIVSKDYNIASLESTKIGDYLKNNIKNEVILGPSVANIFKLNNNYRFQIIIKYKNLSDIKNYLLNLEEYYFNKKNVKLEIDFNPFKL